MNLHPEYTTTDPLTNAQRLANYQRKRSAIPRRRSLEQALDALEAQVAGYNASRSAQREVPFEVRH